MEQWERDEVAELRKQLAELQAKYDQLRREYVEFIDKMRARCEGIDEMLKNLWGEYGEAGANETNAVPEVSDAQRESEA